MITPGNAEKYHQEEASCQESSQSRIFLGEITLIQGPISSLTSSNPV